MEFWLENESPDESVYKATGDLKISFDLPAEADYMVWVRGYNAGGPGRPSAAVAISSRLGKLVLLDYCSFFSQSSFSCSENFMLIK